MTPVKPSTAPRRFLFGSDDSATGIQMGAEFDSLLTDVLNNSPMLEMDGEGSPSQVDEVPPVEEDTGSVNIDEIEIPPAGDPSDDDTADTADETGDPTGTNASDAEIADEDIDLEFKIPVTIDGKKQVVTLAELRKGFATQQHLTAEGRKIGEQRAELERLHSEKIVETTKLAAVFSDLAVEAEKQHAADYKTHSEAYQKARADGDSYGAVEAHEKAIAAQKLYWDARNKREGLIQSVSAKLETAQAESAKKKLDAFQAEIKSLVPDWSPEVQAANLEFAAKHYGIQPEFAASVMSAGLAKMVNDLRVMSQKIQTGQGKAAATRTKMAPVKRQAVTTGQAARTKVAEARVKSGAGSEADILALIAASSPSLKNLQ